MSRSVQPPNYSRPAPAPVTHRVELTGGLKNYIPVKESELVTCYQRHMLGPGISQEIPHVHEVTK